MRKPEYIQKLSPTHYFDNDIYLSEQIAREENERVFSKVWLFCAHESEIPVAGDFITTNMGRVPIVLVRGADRAVRALLNVCPHRGATLVRQPAGNAKSFTCLFHRWGFDTTGRCRAMPQPEGFQDVGLGAADFRLTEYRVETRFGLIFATLNPEAVSLDDYLDGVLKNVEDVIGAQPMEVFHFHRIVIPTNWKLWAATNMELYHVWLHSLNRAISLQEPAWLQRKLKTYRHGHAAFEPTRHAYENTALGTRDLTLPGLAPNEARLAHIFPDMLINIRSSSMRLDRLTPLGPDKVMVEFRGLGLKGESEADRRRRISEHNEFWGPFGRNLPEDVLASTLQMKALQSRELQFGLCAREDGTTPATTDEPLREFHRQWERLMSRSASNPFQMGEVRV